MARDAELDRLKAAQGAAFQRKQNAYQAQQTACVKAFKTRLEQVRASSKNGVKTKSRSLQRLEFRFNIETTSGFRKIQMATPISTLAVLASLTDPATGTTLWISMEP